MDRVVSLLGKPDSSDGAKTAQSHVLSYPGRSLEIETHENRVVCLKIALGSVTVRLKAPRGRDLTLTPNKTVKSIVALLGQPAQEDVDESKGVYTFERGECRLQVETSAKGILERLILMSGL